MALAVRQNLKLDMAGMLHKMLDVHRTVAEGRLCLFFAVRKAWENSSLVQAVRMPFPPPPKAALMMTG